MVICSHLANPERYLESMQFGAFDVHLVALSLA